MPCRRKLLGLAIISAARLRGRSDVPSDASRFCMEISGSPAPHIFPQILRRGRLLNNFAVRDTGGMHARALKASGFASAPPDVGADPPIPGILITGTMFPRSCSSKFAFDFGSRLLTCARISNINKHLRKNKNDSFGTRKLITDEIIW